jgi:integrase
MSQDPEMLITDVQAVLGHAHLSTTQIYTLAAQEDVIAHARAHYSRRAARKAAAPPPPAPGYRGESLSDLFGGSV